MYVATPGRVERLLVARGDAVSRGQQLLRLADTGQQSARSQAHALDVQLAAPIPTAKRSEFEAPDREARSALRNAERALDQRTVRGPRAGTLYSLPVAEGDYLQAGGLVARIGDIRQVHARIFVDEPDLGRVARGSLARITADAYTGREWGCTVDRLATEILEMGPRRIGEVRCPLENSDRLLLPNLAVGVQIVTARAQWVFSIPRAAALRSDGQANVWTAKGGVAVRRQAELGVQGPAYVEIKQGLAPSDVVLTSSDKILAERQRIQIRMDAGNSDE